MHPYFSISSVKASLFVAALLLLPEGSARKITITNSCSGTVWPAYSGYDGAGITVNGKAGTGGWMQAPGQSDVMEVPDSCEWFTSMGGVRFAPFMALGVF